MFDVLFLLYNNFFVLAFVGKVVDAEIKELTQMV